MRLPISQIAKLEGLEMAAISARLRRHGSEDVRGAVAAIHNRSRILSVRNELKQYASSSGSSFNSLNKIFSELGKCVDASEVIRRFELEVDVGNKGSVMASKGWFSETKEVRGRLRAAARYVNRVGVEKLMTLSEIADYEGVSASALANRVESGGADSLAECVADLVRATESRRLTLDLKELGIERRVYDRYQRDFGDILGHDCLVEKILIDRPSTVDNSAAKRSRVQGNCTVESSSSSEAASEVLKGIKREYDTACERLESVESGMVIPASLSRLPLKASLPYCQRCFTVPEIIHQREGSLFKCASCGASGDVAASSRETYVSWVEANPQTTSITDIFRIVTQDYFANGRSCGELLNHLKQKFELLVEVQRLEVAAFEHPIKARVACGFSRNMKLKKADFGMMLRLVNAAIAGKCPPRMTHEGVSIRLSNQKFMMI